MQLIVMFRGKSKGNDRRRNICQRSLSERLDINKICGGFINIREMIKIMRLTKRHQMQRQTKLESLSEMLSTN